MGIFSGCFRINPQKKKQTRTEVQEKNLVQYKNSIPKSTCSPDSKMAWGDEQPNYLCSSLLHVSVYSVLQCSFSLASTNLLGTGFWIHQYAERGAAHHLCLLQYPGKGVLRQKPKRLIWPLHDMAGVFMAGWDGCPPEWKVSLCFSLQFQTSY